VDFLLPESEDIIGPKGNEKCGVAGIRTKDFNSPLYLYYILRSLQHRGQESAGIAIFSEKMQIIKGMGLVHEVLNTETLKKLKSNGGIGHVRYSTAGASNISNAQPLFVHTNIGDISIAHNGEITNAQELRVMLENLGISFNSDSDTEVILRLLSYNILKSNSLIDAIKKTMNYLIGSYSLALMINNRIFAIRDPLGIRPLVLGIFPGGIGFASESVAFDVLGGKIIRDVKPGEIVEILESGDLATYRFGPSEKNHAHCMFEYVYFARADSIIDGRSVYNVRFKLGEILAEESPVDADVVVPVPDSGRTHALGFSHKSGIPFEEGLMKNRYVDRTFIMPDQSGRVQEIMLKLNPVKDVINNKRIVLVDDSIVRGNTMKKIVSLLKDAGAKEVHVRIGSPPIIAPCYLGIDMKTRDQFIATGKTVEEIRKIIGADSLAYISLKGLIKAIGINEDDLCLGCLTGIYPVKINGEKFRGQRSLESF